MLVLSNNLNPAQNALLFDSYFLLKKTISTLIFIYAIIKTSRINNPYIRQYASTYLANSNEFAVRSWQTADIFL